MSTDLALDAENPAPDPAELAHDPAAGLRERKKDATRRALAERAFALAQQRGFAGFTIAELVADVGVSRRTFSNYFASKAECIAAVADGWLDDVLGAIRLAPADISLLQVVQTALVAVADDAAARWGALKSIADTEPELAARVLANDEAIAELVADEVATRSGLPATDIRVGLLSSFAVTAGREVITRWAAQPDRSDALLADLLARAFSVLNPGALAAR